MNLLNWANEMESGIFLRKIWTDDDVVEFGIEVSDGTSIFRNKVYVGRVQLKTLILDLEHFKNAVHGGLFDIRLGEFGPEHASGAFHCRLHFAPGERGLVFATVRMESEWYEFKKLKVASNSTLYFKTEPALFDRFIEELRQLQEQRGDETRLEGV